MLHPISIRFRDARVAERLKALAAERDRSASTIAEELIDEGLRMRGHPLITFRDGPSGRRAALLGGADVWEIVGGIVGGDVPPSKRIARAVELFALSRDRVEAALAYYADYTAEIDGEIAANLAATDEAEARWRRQQDLIAG
jgi:hypothetical protein